MPWVVERLINISCSFRAGDISEGEVWWNREQGAVHIVDGGKKVEAFSFCPSHEVLSWMGGKQPLDSVCPARAGKE